MNLAHFALPQTSPFLTAIHTTNVTHLRGLYDLCLCSYLGLVPYFSNKRKDGNPNSKEEHFPLSPRKELSIYHTHPLPIEYRLWSFKNRNEMIKGILKALYREEIIINLGSICSIMNDHTSNSS